MTKKKLVEPDLTIDSPSWPGTGKWKRTGVGMTDEDTPWILVPLLDPEFE